MKKSSGRVWVNFKELRKRLKFADVLRHYGVEIGAAEGQHQGQCPLPQHAGRRDPRSFSANVGKGVFQCFQCGATGNVLDFAGLMAGIDPEDGSALRKVAVELQLRFCPEGSGVKGKQEPQKEIAETAKVASVSVNAPLDFELKNLEHAHESLAGLGVELKVAVHFGAGFCSRGLLKGRIAVPLHDPEGRLVGYAGLAAEDGMEPGCLFPARRERKGVAFEFDHALLVYNAHRVGRDRDEIIVVQDFAAVWWLHQCGFRNAVALMRPECSEAQAELIVSLVKPGGRVWIIPDGNADGEELAHSLFSQVATERFTRWRRLGEAQQATDLSAEELKVCFAT